MPGSRALFLDRDGVINHDSGYTSKAADFKFIDGIFDLCREAKRSGYVLIVVTNQAGIGRGYYSEQDFFTLTCSGRTSWSNTSIAYIHIYIDINSTMIFSRN